MVRPIETLIRLVPMYDPTKPYKHSILTLIQTTWNTPYISVTPGYNAIFLKNFSFPEVDHTDGIGTKGYFHWKKRSFRNAVLDALAMNLNDLLLSRAIPYKLQNHIMLPKDDHPAMLEIVETFAGECVKRKIAITGGETSVHANLEGLEISATVSGFIKTTKPNKVNVGDVLVGFRSAGLHSNGFTKAREVLGEECLDEFTIPTTIYSDDLLPLNEQIDIHGMMHITGGAFTKFKDLLAGESLRITRNHKLIPSPIFKKLYEKGIPDGVMYRTFNCGIGFVISVSANNANAIIQRFDADIIGEVVRGDNEVIIESMFSPQEIHL